ncbi:MAG TPA: hypothetical protein VG965_07200 [Patescibacteria group bacterium]|nr:hypothetical protein [Patescibacteria group bacterium]
MIGICKNCKKKFKKREKKYIFCSISCSNIFHRNGLISIRKPQKNSTLAEFLGICLGDGSTHKYQITISLNSIADAEYINYVVSLAKRLFPKITISIVKRKANVIDIKINSSLAATFMKDMGIIPNNKTVPAWVYKRKIYKKRCVRGLVDTEGSISTKKYLNKNGEQVEYKQLNFRNYNPVLMKFVKDVLSDLDLKPSVSPVKSLYLSNPKSIKNYLKHIGFGNPKLLKKALA